jgi:exoribonuclease II
MNKKIPTGALVVYKGKPAIVIFEGEKIEIELEGSRLNVRHKDIALIHPGPIKTLKDLIPAKRYFSANDIETAWEILAGEKTDIPELAELISGDFNPVSAWAAWELVQEGYYFRGESPDSITAGSHEEVLKRKEIQEEKEAEEKRWVGFIERASQRNLAPEDSFYLQEVEDLAMGKRYNSRVMKTLGKEERPESAHAFLLDTGYWDATINPHPDRLGLNLSLPQAGLPELGDEDRRDLTHLSAFAIDDEGSQDPDDAISLEGEWKIWVHTADAAVLAPPDSPADIEARSRGTNLYLPETTVPMLPPKAARLLGMGLEEISPALSFGIELNQKGEIEDVEVVPSWVKVKRLSYEVAATQMTNQPFSRLYEIGDIYLKRRRQNGAVSIDLPEVKVRVSDGLVSFIPIPALPSRTLVREAMVMAGEAAALFALNNGIPVPFAVQPPSAVSEAYNSPPEPDDLAGMYALRRIQNRGRVSSHPAPHAGLGLSYYTRVTSPLRRYLDLTAHQQLRLFLHGYPVLEEQVMVARVGESEALTSSAARAENLSRRHWTLVHFLLNPDWQGEGVIVEKRNSQVRLIIPELGFEAQTAVRGDLPLNTRIKVSVKSVNLPELEATIHTELG